MKIFAESVLALSLLLGVSVLAMEPPARPGVTNVQPTRVVVLPFQNATGDTNWNDWQWALPSLVRAYFHEAESTFVVAREKTKVALKRTGWVTGQKLDASLARRVAQEMNASVVVWGGFKRQNSHWIVDAQLQDVNSSAGPAPIKLASPDLGRLPEQVATNLVGLLARPNAERDFQYARKHLPHSEAGMKLLARAFTLIEPHSSASEEKVLRQLLAEDPHCALAHALFTQILVGEEKRTNELTAAAAEFLRQCPDCCMAHLGRAWLLAMARDESGMQHEWIEALRVHPGCPEACLDFFRYLGRGHERWDELVKILEPAHAVRPRDAGITILLAAAKAQSGARDDADTLLEGISDLPEEEETMDVALLAASSATGQIELAGRELSRLGPQSVTNAFIREVLNSARFVFLTKTNEIGRPRQFTLEELDAELARRLSVEERKLVVHPIEITPDTAAESRRLSFGLTNQYLRTVALCAEVSRRGRGDGDGGIRTASQALAQASDPQTRFSCQEHAKLFVALARSLGIESWLVHIGRGADGEPCYHDCAVVFVNGSGVLVDPAWRAIGIGHKEFKVLDDLQAISHQAMQLAGQLDANRLRMGLKLNPDDRWTQLQFVRGMARLRAFDVAAEELAKAQKTGVESWDTHEVAGELELEREHWQPALAELRRALELSPSNAIVHFHLSQAYGGAGDHAKSTEHMEAALRLDRGEIPKNLRRETAAQIASMKTFLRGTSGDSSARSEMRASAEAGDVIAQIGMAKACFAAHQYEEALDWEAKAARQGNAQAQYDYANNLYMVRPDAGKEAVQWFTRAASQGHSKAQYSLGKFLYEGGPVPPDKVAAGKWIFLAAGAGNNDAKHLWNEMELFLSAAELVEARKQAAAFKPVSEERAGGEK